MTSDKRSCRLMVAFVFLLISSSIIGLFIGLSDPFMTNEEEDDALSSVFEPKGNVLVLRKPPFLRILLSSRKVAHFLILIVYINFPF